MEHTNQVRVSRYKLTSAKGQEASPDAIRANPSLAQLRLIQSDLAALLAEVDEGDPEATLSNTAFAVADEILVEVGTEWLRVGAETPTLFPYGSVCSDGEGGVRIEWRLGDQGVSLAASRDGTAYIYFEGGDSFGAEPYSLNNEHKTNQPTYTPAQIARRLKPQATNTKPPFGGCGSV